MKRLLALLMLLFMPTAHAEAPPVILLPEGLFCLADAPVGAGAETRLLVTAEPDANAVRLAIAVRDEDGVCRLEALSGPFLPLDNWNPDALNGRMGAPVSGGAQANQKRWMKSICSWGRTPPAHGR